MRKGGQGGDKCRRGLVGESMHGVTEGGSE